MYNLSEKYKVETVKGYFPHSFANENTLFYIGELPHYNYYKSDKLSKEDSEKIEKTNK